MICKNIYGKSTFNTRVVMGININLIIIIKSLPKHIKKIFVAGM